MIEINYVTSSPYKKEEISRVAETIRLADGRLIQEVFNFNILGLSIKEHLEVDIAALVMAEVSNAYSQLKVPCIVEHAGLIFGRHYSKGYPGGLTKPMWDVLQDDFVSETASANQVAFARACIGYCDGLSIATFTGETKGTIASEPRGSRSFYWDTVFIPDTTSGVGTDLTYAQIVDDPNLGLAHKMAVSQSTKAIVSFLEYRFIHEPLLWS